MTKTAPVGHSISAAEAALRLGISVRTLTRMAHPGHAQHLEPINRVGHHRRYDADQVERVRRGLPAKP